MEVSKSLLRSSLVLARGAMGSSSLSSPSDWVGVSGSPLFPPQARSESAGRKRANVNLCSGLDVCTDQCAGLCVSLVLHLSPSPRGFS